MVHASPMGKKTVFVEELLLLALHLWALMDLWSWLTAWGCRPREEMASRAFCAAIGLFEMFACAFLARAAISALALKSASPCRCTRCLSTGIR